MPRDLLARCFQSRCSQPHLLDPLDLALWKPHHSRQRYLSDPGLWKPHL